jgi:hypothetical protein
MPTSSVIARRERSNGDSRRPGRAGRRAAATLGTPTTKLGDLPSVAASTFPPLGGHVKRPGAARRKGSSRTGRGARGLRGRHRIQMIFAACGAKVVRPPPHASLLDPPGSRALSDPAGAVILRMPPRATSVAANNPVDAIGDKRLPASHAITRGMLDATLGVDALSIALAPVLRGGVVAGPGGLIRFVGSDSGAGRATERRALPRFPARGYPPACQSAASSGKNGLLNSKRQDDC